MAEDVFHVVLAATLRAVIAEKGLKPQDVADRSGITQSTVSRTLLGTGTPSVHKFVTICNVLGVPPHEVMLRVARLEDKLDKLVKERPDLREALLVPEALAKLEGS